MIAGEHANTKQTQRHNGEMCSVSLGDGRLHCSRDAVTQLALQSSSFPLSHRVSFRYSNEARALVSRSHHDARSTLLLLF